MTTKELKEYQVLQKKIELAIQLLLWAKKRKFYSDIDVSTLVDGEIKILFDCQAQSYKFVHEFSRYFKIKFNKVKSANDRCLDYKGETKDMIVKLYAISELPPSCRVEYKTVIVPATKRHAKTVATVVCK